jgi:flagellar motility protein MotE (MotC chaperone)
MKNTQALIPALAVMVLLTLPGLVLSAAEQKSAGPSSVEERRIRSAIEEQYNRLQKEGDQFKVEEMQLKTLKLEVDKKLGQMQNLRQELSQLLERKQAEEGKRVVELSKIYEKMDSSKAAELIKGLEPRLAIELLGAMNKKNAGQILDNLDRETATRLSTGFTEIPLEQSRGY